MTVNYGDLAGESWTDDTEAETVHAAEHGDIASALHALRDALGGAAFDTYLGASTLAAKLNTVAAALTAAVQRANHTGTQAISTVTGLQTALDGKETAGAAAAVQTTLVNGAPPGGDTLAELDTRLAVIEALGSLATDAELAANLAAILGTATTDADTLGELEALNALRMLKSANLSDLANAATARTNLDVYAKAAVDAAIADAIVALPELVSSTEFAGVVYDEGGAGPSTTLTPRLVNVVRNVGKALGVTSTPGTGAQSLLVSTITPVANSVPAGAWLTAVAHGLVTNNDGVDRTCTFRLRIGTTNLCNVQVTLPTGGSRSWRLYADIPVGGGASPVAVNGTVTLNVAALTDVDDAIVRTESAALAAVVDLTNWAPHPFDLTVQLSVNDADLSASCYGLMVNQVN